MTDTPDKALADAARGAVKALRSPAPGSEASWRDTIAFRLANALADYDQAPAHQPDEKLRRLKRWLEEDRLKMATHHGFPHTLNLIDELLAEEPAEPPPPSANAKTVEELQRQAGPTDAEIEAWRKRLLPFPLQSGLTTPSTGLWISTRDANEAVALMKRLRAEVERLNGDVTMWVKQWRSGDRELGEARAEVERLRGAVIQQEGE